MHLVAGGNELHSQTHTKLAGQVHNVQLRDVVPAQVTIENRYRINTPCNMQQHINTNLHTI